MELSASACVPEPIQRRNSVEPRPVLVVRRENYNLYQREKDEIMNIYAKSLAFPHDKTQPRDFVINNNTHLTSDQISLMQLLFDLEILNEKYMLMDESSIRRVINPVIISRAYIRPRLYLPDCSKHIWLSELEKEVLNMSKLERADLKKIS
jgi:hypothetical protein